MLGHCQPKCMWTVHSPYFNIYDYTFSVISPSFLLDVVWSTMNVGPLPTKTYVDGGLVPPTISMITLVTKMVT